MPSAARKFKALSESSNTSPTLDLPPLFNVTPIYTHTPLSLHHEFRILNLIPGSEDTPVRFSLSTERFPSQQQENLPKKTPVKYDVLNYTYHQPDQDGESAGVEAFIYDSPVSGVPSHIMTIDGRLANALVAMRDLNRLKEVWVHSVCMAMEDVTDDLKRENHRLRVLKGAKKIWEWVIDLNGTGQLEQMI